MDFRANAVGGQLHDRRRRTTWSYGSSKNDVLTGSAGQRRTATAGRATTGCSAGPGPTSCTAEDGNDWLEAGTAAESADGGAGVRTTTPTGGRSAAAACDDVRQAGAGDVRVPVGPGRGAAAGIDLGGRITYLGDYAYKVRLYNADAEEAHTRRSTFDGTISTYLRTAHWYDPVGGPRRTSTGRPVPAGVPEDDQGRDRRGLQGPRLRHVRGHRPGRVGHGDWDQPGDRSRPTLAAGR